MYCSFESESSTVYSITEADFALELGGLLVNSSGVEYDEGMPYTFANSKTYLYPADGRTYTTSLTSSWSNSHGYGSTDYLMVPDAGGLFAFRLMCTLEFNDFPDNEYVYIEYDIYS